MITTLFAADLTRYNQEAISHIYGKQIHTPSIFQCIMKKN